MVTPRPRRARSHELQRFSLGPLIVLLVVVAVLFGVSSTASKHYTALTVAAVAGLLMGFLQGLVQGRGTRSVLIQSLIGLVVGITAAKILLGEANLPVLAAGSALILATALALRLLRTFGGRAEG